MDIFYNCRHVFRTLGILFFLLFRSIFTKIQRIVWSFNGIAETIEANKRPENYSRCAQVLKVVHAHDHYITVACSLRNFIVVHERFERPGYILENEHVTLVTVDSEYAVFGRAKAEDMHLWKLEFGSFLKLAQVRHCSRLILVPLVHFHRMAEELGDPEKPIVFLFNTARCGSTLLTHMLEKTEQCVSISEPSSLDALERWSQHRKSPEQISLLCRDVIRWICRPYRNLVFAAYWIKVVSPNIVFLPVISELFPRSHFLFMYRDVVSHAKSILRYAEATPLRTSISFLAKRSTMLRRLFEDFVDFHSTEHDPSDYLTVAVTHFAFCCKTYLEHRRRRRRLRIAAIRYEDLIGDPYYSMKKILDYCNLPSSEETDHLRRAVEAMGEDAQRNSHLSRDNMRRLIAPQLTDESILLANGILLENGLPLITSDGSDYILEGTITNRGVDP